MWLCDHIRSFHILLLIKPLLLLISLLTIFVLLIYLLISPNQMISSFFTPSQIPLALDHDRVSAHQWSCPRRIQHWQFQSSQDRKNDETWMKHGWTWLETSWLYILKATLRTMWKTGNSGHLWCECLIHFASAVLVTSAFNPSLYSIAILAIRTKMEITWQQTSFRKASVGLQWPAYPSSIGLHKWCFPCGSISCGSKQQIVQVSQGQLSEISRKT